MSKKQFKELLFLCLFLTSQAAVACSCTRYYFCDYLKHEEQDYKMVAVRAKVLDKIVYADSTNAVYLEVLESYRDDVGVGSFLKLYGDYQEADCHINLRNRFTILSEVLVIVGVSTTFNNVVNEIGFPFENPIPDTGNYWEFSPLLCQFSLLQIENGIVKGYITEEINEYPWDLFNDMLEDCDFSLEELNELRCEDDNFIVYPNPNPNGIVKIENSYDKPPISLIRVFDANGIFIQEHSFPPDYFFRKRITIEESGLFFLEIHCNEHIYTEQILIL